MARDTYIKRPKMPPRPEPQPPTREERMAAIAYQALENVARSLAERQAQNTRKPHTGRDHN